MKISRLYTTAGKNVYDMFEYSLRSSVLRNPDGSVVFEMHDIEVPSRWSQMATDILAQKYFRKAGVPQFDAEGNQLFNEQGEPILGAEKSARQVVHRLAGCWRHWGEEHGYFDSPEDAQAFYDEIAYTLLNQMAAPNSPQWFNTGLHWAYGIEGPAQGHYYVDPETGKLTRSKDAYTHPQPHACARGNTRLFTDRGVLEIREIVEGNRTDLRVFDGNDFVPVQAVKNNGVRRIWRATLKNGNFIEFTGDHLVWSADRREKDGGQYGWHELETVLGQKVLQTALPYGESVSIGEDLHAVASRHGEMTSMMSDLHTLLDREGIEGGFDEESSETTDIDVKSAALAGWIVGDGYYGKYNRNNKTTLFGAITVNEDEYAFVTDLFASIFGTYKVVTRKNVHDLYRIVKLDSKVVDDFVERYELDAGSLVVKVPERIFKGRREEKVAFLRSLFQADGCVRIRNADGRNSGDVVLSTISEELAHGVQVLLLSLGIYANVAVGHDSRQNRHPLYHVSISWSSERCKFENSIGFLSAEKKEKLRRLNQTVSGKNKGEASEETVISIDYVGEETVYDIQTATSRFAANGVIVHNCFIQSVSDDLVNEGGIFDLVTREARIFKYGSGTGSNFSELRGEGEPLSGGGVSSGLMSFLKVNDRAAGAVKSGGTTRRAAKMVILNIDHPDIEKFIDWKMVEEQKVAALVAGSRICRAFLAEIAEVGREQGTDYSDPSSELHSLVQRALSRGIPFNYIVRVLSLVDQGMEKIDFNEYDLNYEGEAYNTVSGQNSNNSVRISNDFMKAVAEDGDWHLTWRTSGERAKTVKARYLWEKVNYAAWSCADPGLQFDTTINEWHTSPKEGRINGSNPCSEYMYLDDTACVAGETRISTPEGLRTVEELYGIQETGRRVTITTDIYSEHDHRHITAHRPAYVTKVGEKQTYRVRTKDGRMIRATEEHRFLTDKGVWKRVDELVVGSDRIEIRQSGNPVSFTSPEQDIRRWQALGWMTGDGVFSKGNVAMVFGPNEEETGRRMEVEFNSLLDDAYEWIAREEDDDLPTGPSIVRDRHVETRYSVAESGAVVAEPMLSNRGVSLGRQKSGVMQMTSKSTALVRYLEEVYGFTQGTAIYKKVPTALHSVADDLKVAFLQGLFSADGCIRKAATEKEVMLASSSDELLRSVQLLLSDFGIVGRITWTHPKGRKNPQGQLHLHNQQARKFLTLIGFPCSAAKNQEAKGILSETFDAQRRNPRPVTVISVEKDSLTTVYDITEPVTHSFIAEGLITHNCNLASLNLGHFYDDETGLFDVESYKHATRIWTTVLEISVLMAQFPSKEIAQKSYDTRTLGLGYANLGTILMRAGIPYDSDEGRAWAGAITAVMTGESYATSAEMSGRLGAFNKYKRNAKDMLRVMRNHRRAAYNAPEGEYEGLTVTPVGIDHSLCPANLSAAAKECWDRAVSLGEEHGYRNAQVTVIAPTGTISLIMDCDTTGIEPDFALVKFKKLAGGGYFKIVNQSVPKALSRLDYSDAEIADISSYIKGYASLKGCPHINRASLKAKGFTDEKVDAVESGLETAFDITFAFNRYSLGDEFLKSIGFTDEQVNDPSLNVLAELGFSKEEIEEANRYVCGTMTIEGAPYLKEEHLPIFDCANRCGKIGKRYIAYMGHVKMMAAAQPFISGAISKTINMPREATLEDVEKVYLESWKLMLKAIALYRDGSKLSQPLNVSAESELVEQVTLRDIDVDASHMVGSGQDFNEQVGPQQVQEKIVEKVYHRADRRRLPKRRHGFVREATVGGHKVFLRTGEYEDGKLGEIFIDMYKEGASFKGLLNCFAVLASKALQYGMPLEKMVDTFTFTRFEPSGPVQGHEAIKNATSIVDYVFRAIGYEYLGREDFIHIKAVDETEGIEYGPGDEESGTARLSPGRELWERQQYRKRETNGGTGGAKTNGGTNGTNGAGGSVRTAQATRTGNEAEEKVATARAQGYTGEQCGNCGSMRVKQNGACHVCEECGTTSGCS